MRKAGLFSAVVTAFVIVSYTSLQPDQGEITNTLLARIADRLDNPLNRSSSPAMPVNTVSLANSPNSSSIRINIYWSISLVLSLTTALMGIVAVQWLKQHQTYPASYSSMQKFATFNMRAEGLRAWYVPQIFSALPLLLQAALALFFLGLIEFLLNSSSTVAIPVIISTLNTILSKIQGSTERIMDRRSDFLFYLSSFCVRMNLLRFPSYYDRPELLNYVERPEPKFDDVLAALRQYLEARKAPDEDLRKTMNIPDLDQAWWSFLTINRDKEDEEAVDSLPEISGKPPSSSSIIEISPRPAVLQEDCRGTLDDMPSTNVDASYLV
ncbi:hypothetical protein CVT26_006151 [Gymnopilus dilepis]|uniref:DUF6535 domain-containing protein n=1 Tax=Gymnopilus dilepis TaxID=231916 RepID=A0A409WGB5_9AGAR|nr:hypothetical protein CVT26_006151 [Gymnopilus dilepis]